MPRAESKHLGTQFYHSQFSNSPYLQDNSPSTPPSPPASTASSQSAHQAAPAAAAPKKKHVCSTCDRAFTTSGHLARHSRVHTGERNHKCPFPGCETRCSRQDNLQQHYRIHLSPGSRRSSARNAAARNMNKRGSTASTVDSPSAPPALSTPPALEPARVYNHHSTPPDSPPPLAQATLPATASLLTASRMESSSNRSSPSSPDTPYASGSHMVPLSSQGMSLSPSAPQGYSYRSGTTTYQEQSQGAGFTYVHTTPITQSSSYSSHDNFSNHSMSARDQQNSLPSRHSISHISHPQSSYPQGSSSSTTPPSPSSSHSVSSHTSGPPTPTYPGFHDEGRAYHPNGMMNNNGNHIGGGGAGGASHSNGVVTHNGYSSNHVQDNGNGRFNSPPPTLAPIQNERFIRRDEHPSGHSDSSYIHHPQPMSTEYGYHHQSLALSHGAWKAENGMRKGVGAAIV